jgi:homoserine dehydrogenase
LYYVQFNFGQPFRDKVVGVFIAFFIAPLQTDSSVGLLPKRYPFYNLERKENNIVLFLHSMIATLTSINGAGAGAAVTASGILPM